MNLFKRGNFTGHSGAVLPWKIECDAVSPAEWAWAAERVAERFKFVGVEAAGKGGGERFADALRLHQNAGTDSNLFLICDDVFTTGASMEQTWRELRSSLDAQGYVALGVVMFARASTPSWIMPLWQFW